jgi:hypothetical protein
MCHNFVRDGTLTAWTHLRAAGWNGWTSTGRCVTWTRSWDGPEKFDQRCQEPNDVRFLENHGTFYEINKDRNSLESEAVETGLWENDWEPVSTRPASFGKATCSKTTEDEVDMDTETQEKNE